MLHGKVNAKFVARSPQKEYLGTLGKPLFTCIHNIMSVFSDLWNYKLCLHYDLPPPSHNLLLDVRIR